MSAATVTGVAFAGVDSLLLLRMISRGTIRTSVPRRAPRTPQSPAAGLPAGTAQPAPAVPAAGQAHVLHAVARSTDNPGLARYAASRARDPQTGQFLPIAAREAS
jgi:hypothetical protein